MRVVAAALCLGLAAAPATAAPAARDGAETARERFERQRRELAEAELIAAADYFQELAEWALSLRARTVAAAREVEEEADGRPIGGGRLVELRLGTGEHLAVRDEMLRLVVLYRGWTGAPSAGSSLPDELRVKGVMLSLAGALVLYDNFAVSVALFQGDARLRRILNRSDRGFGLEADSLLGALRRYYSPAERQEVRAALAWLDARRPVVERLVREDRQAAYFDALIASSPSAAAIAEGNLVDDWLAAATSVPDVALDALDLFRDETAQQAIGTLLAEDPDAVPVHRGALRPTPQLVASIEGTLEPLDLLLDKSRWRSVDKVIPGYFTHVGIWLGGEPELRRLGLWRHPLVVPHHEQLERGEAMLEAVRAGVRLVSVERFLNLDDLAVLRRVDLDREGRRAALLRAFRQVGKEYDFNFAVETTDRLVCSEVPYLVFADLDWPTESLLGRATISPDNVAVTALGDGPFRLVRLFVDGREVRKRRLEVYRALIAPGT